jgi:hypothetical protein
MTDEQRELLLKAQQSLEASFRIFISRYQTHKPENMGQRINYVKETLLSHSL